MTARVLQPFRKAEYAILEAALPGKPCLAAGVLLLDPWDGGLRVRLRQDWEQVDGREDAEVLSRIEEDLARRAAEGGGAALLEQLEDTLSNVLRISDRRAVVIADPDRALDRLYQEHVEGSAGGQRAEPPAGQRLPVYTLRAAATRFGEDMEVEPEGYVPAPPNLRRTANHFVARVVGRSMEPLIPDGSLCIFRYPVEGSRQGKLLLIQRQGASAGGGEFTVKRYTSVKTVTVEGWRHERIRLEPLNPEFEAWDLDPSELENGPYRVLGEFVQVLPYEDQ
ncbi:MAG: S24 family peptidase [Bryobacteraceae bacterium]|nr:S24 family peptidase [Bryobacteraceae bacterium]